MHNTTKQFLEHFLRGPSPRLPLFFVRGSSTRVVDCTPVTLTAALNEAVSLNKEGWHVYFCTALRTLDFDTKNGTSYGGKKAVSHVNGYHVDVDFLPPDVPNPHASSNLPTPAEALQVFAALSLEPTIIVNSGNGYHLHFLFEEPLPIDETNTIKTIERAALAFAQPIQKAFEAKGWDCDATKTATIQRVWRLPGFDNHKTDPPSPCHVYRATLHARTAYIPPSTFALPLNTPSAPSESIVNYNGLKKFLTERSSKDLPGLWRDVYAGKTLPDAPGHNNLTQRLASSIAFADKGQTRPEALVEVLRPSLIHWANKEDASMSIEERIAEVTAQIAKAQADYFEDAAEKQNIAHNQLAAALGDLAPEVDPRYLICRHGVRNLHMFDFARKEYCRYPQQGYDGAYAFIKSNWTAANGCPLLHTKMQKGQITPLSPRDYIHSNSVQVKVIKSSYIQDHVSVTGDERGVNLILPAGNKRALTPKEHPDIHDWLLALAGDDPQVHRLFTLWLAALYRQDRVACLLYLHGMPEAGKSTFAQGIGRMWEQQPANLAQVFQRFNADAESTPIWWADEKLDLKGAKIDVSAAIRDTITRRDHKIERKGLEIYELEGYGRLVVTANDMRALASPFNSQQSEHGKEATATRILYLRTSPRAVELMDARSKEFDVKEHWVIGNRIAEHVLYLRDRYYDEVTHYPHRMIGSVPTAQDNYRFEKYRLLAPSSDFDSTITSWFAALLDRMQDHHQVASFKDHITIREGGLYLKASAIPATWDRWDDTSAQGAPPKARAVADFLRNVCEDREYRLEMDNGKRSRFRKVIPQRLLQHLDTALLSEEAALEHFEELKIDISDLQG